MKATIPYKRIENTLFAIIPLLVGWRITSYYTSALPDFDIAANDIFITIECTLQESNLDYSQALITDSVWES